MHNSFKPTAIAAILLLGVVFIMGMYDSFFYDGNKELQLKTGQCGLNEFHIGDDVFKYGYENGIYLDVTGVGVVVIWGGIYVAGFDVNCIKDKWGNEIDFWRASECRK